ncbi:MAG: hypothetical protein DMF40_01690 [Verrucomicrobia bacterium]|nr:MAG: hypothetical protein DMF40_01690 [Verrucomicrobiota bacterium]
MAARSIFSRWHRIFRVAPSLFRATRTVDGLSRRLRPSPGNNQDADPYITADRRHFYFISDRPVEMDGERQSHHDIWVMDKTESGWSAPRHLPASVNSAADEFYPMALQNGTLYFGSQRKDPNGPGDIYRALPQSDGSYAVQGLGRPVNSAGGEYEAFVTEDERMLSLAVSGGARLAWRLRSLCLAQAGRR